MPLMASKTLTDTSAAERLVAREFGTGTVSEGRGIEYLVPLDHGTTRNGLRLESWRGQQHHGGERQSSGE